MKLMITGHEGYVGAGLCEYFHDRHEIIGWGRMQDIRTLDSTVIRRLGPDAVINCAAAIEKSAGPIVPGSKNEAVNIHGTRKLVDALQDIGIPLIHLSTKDIFGPVYQPKDLRDEGKRLAPKFLIAEDHPAAPETAYGKSKLESERIVANYPHTTVIRLSTCYTDQNHYRGSWIQAFLNRARSGEPIQIHGSGKQVRDPVHVNDLGSLMEKVLSSKKFGQTIHAGGGEKNIHSLIEVIEMIDPKAKVTHTKEGGDLGFAFDIRKANSLYGWDPRILLKEKLR